MPYFVVVKSEATGRNLFYGGFDGKNGRAFTTARNNAPTFGEDQAKQVVRQLEALDNRGWEILDQVKV